MGLIVVSQVGKAYRRYPGKWSRALEWITGRDFHEKTWVLRDVSFAVQPGEAVALVGINGAGKSTLLKIITGTTRPTTGSVHMDGRVAALLELGMGFHPDFTGRQNAFMAGQLLGLATEEIAACMPAIEAFAEIGDYIDRPVRTYSSGMQVRLAFSVATAVRPDILIVDEALSVGDAYFQHKSFDRIRQFQRMGSTMLIVSHDRTAIQNLCSRAILLEQGGVSKDGNPEEVMDYYNAVIAEKENATIVLRPLDDGRLQTLSGTGEATVAELGLFDAGGRRIECLDVGQPVILRVEVDVHAPIERLVLGYAIKDRLGQVIFGTNTKLKDQVVLRPAVGGRLAYDIAFPANLGPGSYSVQTALCSSETHMTDNYEWRDLALIFTMVNLGRPLFAGCAWIDPVITISAA